LDALDFPDRIVDGVSQLDQRTLRPLLETYLNHIQLQAAAVLQVLVVAVVLAVPQRVQPILHLLHPSQHLRQSHFKDRILYRDYKKIIAAKILQY
jgi:hypothetical protein